jgi:3-oxoacyl-[acyl-carrier-protein] synthase III
MDLQGIRIVSTGLYLPRHPKSDLRAAAGKSIEKEWGELFDREGGGFVARGESAVDMGAAAGREALTKAGVDPRTVGMILAQTVFCDFDVPRDSCAIAKALGAVNASAYFVDTACASFLSMCNLAAGLIRSGQTASVLVVNVAHWASRALPESEDIGPMGDGAAAVLFESSKENTFLGHVETRSDEHISALYARSAFATDKREYLVAAPTPGFREYLYEDVPILLAALLDKARLRPAEVDWFLPAQPTGGIMHKWSKDAGFSEASLLHTFPVYGNLAATTVPANLHHFTVIEPRIRRGDKIVFFSTGAGFHLMASAWVY